jgi:urea transporter
MIPSFEQVKTEGRMCCDALLHSYSIIFFSQSRVFGAVLLAATLSAPRFGLLGLVGLLVAYIAARLLGFERSSVRKGIYLFNSLLVSLALAYLNNFQTLELPVLATLLVAASVITLFASVFMFDVFFRHYALPALSFPFVWVAFALFFLFYSFHQMPITSETPLYLLPAVSGLPDLATGFFQALGAIFFLPQTTVGILVFACLIVWSRLAVLYAVVGYVFGVLLMQGLGMDTLPGNLGFIGFNFVFCGIALGGIFLVPSRGSLLMVVLGSFFCVTIAVAVNTFLKYFGVPPLALPLNLVILLVLYAMKCRTRVKHLFVTPFAPDSPEKNFRRFNTDVQRFPDALQPHLHLPFFGERTITQAFRGDVTHRGEWGEAFDFEIIDDDGHRFAHNPPCLDGNHVFDTPVLSPCNGTIVKVVSDVHDNPIGQTNTDRNWGNVVIIRDDLGYYVKLCHLKQGSNELMEGVRVVRGQLIGRCGNSGRSPAPHLHMQVQHTAQIGDKTVPFRLSQYYTKVGSRRQYHSSGVPVQDDTIAPVEFDKYLAACFEFGETSWAYRFKGDIETIRCTLDDSGIYVLTSGNARLTACINDSTFYTLDYKGGCDSVLFYIHLGLCRTPFVSENDVFWKDRIDLRPLLHPLAAIVLDLFGPFFKYPLADMECRTVRNESRTIDIHSSVRYPVPRCFLRKDCPSEIIVGMSSDGIERIDIEANGSAGSCQRLRLAVV